MFKKILFGALTILLALSLVGCGDEKTDDAKKNPKAEEKVSAPAGNADKAVLAYAQLYAYGVIEDENMTAAGLTDKDVEKIQDQVIKPLVESFKQYPLSDESVAEMTAQYVAKLHMAMEMKAAVKKDDATNPVVELKATTINQAGAMEVAANNESLIELGAAYGELQAQGMTEDQLKENAEFQQFALERINAFIDEFPLNPESSIDVICEAAEGSDGKIYWAPKNPEEIAKFVTGQK